MLSPFVYLECHPRRIVSPSPRDLGGRRLPRPCRGVSALDCSFSYVFPNFQLSTVDSQPPLFPKSFSCNTYRSPHKCCKQKTYGIARFVRCNTYKKPGYVPQAKTFSILATPPFLFPLPPIFRTLFQVPYPVSPLFVSLTKAAGCVPKIPILERAVRTTSKRSTFKRSSRSSRPIAAERPWCHNERRHENSSSSGETTPLPPVSNYAERTSGTARPWFPLQVVPGSIVLKLD